MCMETRGNTEILHEASSLNCFFDYWEARAQTSHQKVISFMTSSREIQSLKG